MTLSIRNIIPIIKAQFVGVNEIAVIDSVSIDSRSLQNSESTLFFAIIGPNHDGHHYISNLISIGVSNFVVNHVPKEFETKANFLVVENTVEALQNFALVNLSHKTDYRKQFTGFKDPGLVSKKYFSLSST